MEKEITIEKKKEKKPSSDLQKRLIYSLSMIVLWKVLAHITVPGINFESLDKFLTERGGYALGFPHELSRISVLALGLMPYITAYVIVEILALFLPPLKSWRASGYRGRIKLKKTALFATILLSFVQGYGIATGLEGMNEGRFVYNPGWNFRLIFIFTLTAGTFLSIWIAEMITQKGIGHGISLVIFAGYGSGFFSNLLRAFKTSNEHSPFEIYLISAFIAALLILLIVLAEKSYRRIPIKFDNGDEVSLPLKLTAAGTVPTDWAALLVWLPSTVFSFISTPVFLEITHALSPGQIGYYVIYFIAIIFLYYLFTSFFYNPKKIVAFLRDKNSSIMVPSSDKEEDYIDRSLKAMIPVGALYLCLLVFLPEIIIHGLGFPMFIGGVGLITAVAIALDLIGEWNVRKKYSSLINIAEFHDLPKAGFLKSIFEKQRIPCHLRGYYHRALLYFFGPFIEVSVLVPEDKIDDATEIIKHYMNGKI